MAKEKDIEKGPEDRDVAAQALGYLRRHPVLAVLGTAGAGLIGGIELAFGVLIGAGVAAISGKPNAARQAVHEAKQETARAGERLAKIRPEMEKRARAILQAARGRLAPAGT
jgi:hypothetical protein